MRLALRMERVAHDITRRTMALTLDASEGKSAVIRSLVAILDHHGIEHPPLPREVSGGDSLTCRAVSPTVAKASVSKSSS